MSAADALIRALRVNFVKLGAAATVEEIASRPWASATFSGARHRLRLRVDGDDAERTADAFLDDLADREFELDGHILADIGLVEEARGDDVRLTLEALTVEVDQD